jgi:hypothetical protein
VAQLYGTRRLSVAAEDNLVRALATSASTSAAGTRTIDSTLDLRHMRRAISKKNQLPSAMPKGQRTKELASKGIE